MQVLSVTYVRGGGALNVIPLYVELGGTLRSLTTEGLLRLQQRVKEVFSIFRILMCFSVLCLSLQLHLPSIRQ